MFHSVRCPRAQLLVVKYYTRRTVRNILCRLKPISIYNSVFIEWFYWHSTSVCITAFNIMVPLQKVYFKRSQKNCYDIILFISRISSIKFIFGAVLLRPEGNCSLCVISAHLMHSSNINCLVLPAKHYLLISLQIAKSKCLKLVPLSEQKVKNQYLLQWYMLIFKRREAVLILKTNPSCGTVIFQLLNGKWEMETHETDAIPCSLIISFLL